LNGYIDGRLTIERTSSLRRAALPFVLLPLVLAGCHQGYSPNTYAANAAQVEANVQRGTIIGVRQVVIAANGTVGAATGAAVGGVAGSQIAGAPVATALGAIGGTLVGGIGGTVAAQAVSDTKGWEYIVQEDGDRLVSVTQTSKMALPIGLHVLVIAGTQQARIVPDYTVQIAATPPQAKPVADAAKPAPAGSTTVEINISPVLPDAAASQDAPVMVASDPAAANAAAPAPKAAPGRPGQSAPAVAETNQSVLGGPVSTAATVTPAASGPTASIVPASAGTAVTQ
jgi:outer membrane lipoprotein SlyB